MQYRCIVGICFGSCCADYRQAVEVNFYSKCKTVTGFRNAALKAARNAYPSWSSLFTNPDCSIVRVMPGCCAPELKSYPIGTFTWNGSKLNEGWF